MPDVNAETRDEKPRTLEEWAAERGYDKWTIDALAADFRADGYRVVKLENRGVLDWVAEELT